MSTVEAALPLPAIYYQHTTKNYWIKDAGRKWIHMNETSVARKLKSIGHDPRVNPGEMISELDDMILRLQMEQNVDYAGPLAGYMEGLYPMNESNVLVTSSPKFITPRQGDWKMLQALIDGLLVDPVYDQRVYFYGWLKRAVESVKCDAWLWRF